MSEWQQSSERAVLVALVELAARATGGPWQYVPDVEVSSMGWIDAPVEYQNLTYHNLVAKILGDSAEAAHTADFIAAARNATDAITAALALADRVAELERLLAEERAVVAACETELARMYAREVWENEEPGRIERDGCAFADLHPDDQRELHKSYHAAAQDHATAHIEATRAAHRNAAQQEGQGDGK